MTCNLEGSASILLELGALSMRALGKKIKNGTCIPVRVKQAESTYWERRTCMEVELMYIQAERSCQRAQNCFRKQMGLGSTNQKGLRIGSALLLWHPAQSRTLTRSNTAGAAV